MLVRFDAFLPTFYLFLISIYSTALALATAIRHRGTCHRRGELQRVGLSHKHLRGE